MRLYQGNCSKISSGTCMSPLMSTTGSEMHQRTPDVLNVVVFDGRRITIEEQPFPRVPEPAPICCGSSPFSAIAASLSAFAHYAVTRLHLADLRTSTSDFVERHFVGRLRDHRIVTRTRTAGGPVDPASPFIYLRVCLALYFRFELVCPPSIHLAFPHLSPAERRFRRVSPVIVTPRY